MIFLWFWSWEPPPAHSQSHESATVSVHLFWFWSPPPPPHPFPKPWGCLTFYKFPRVTNHENILKFVAFLLILKSANPQRPIRKLWTYLNFDAFLMILEPTDPSRPTCKTMKTHELPCISSDSGAGPRFRALQIHGKRAGTFAQVNLCEPVRSNSLIGNS